MRLRNLGAEGAHSGKLPCPPGPLLKGARSLKGAYWARQGQWEASALGSESSSEGGQPSLR